MSHAQTIGPDESLSAILLNRGYFLKRVDHLFHRQQTFRRYGHRQIGTAEDLEHCNSGHLRRKRSLKFELTLGALLKRGLTLNCWGYEELFEISKK